MKLWVILTLLLVPVLIEAQQLNMKSGAWEMTHKSAMLPRAIVDKECVTAADIGQLAAGSIDDDDTDCKYVKPPAVLGNKWSADKLCPAGRKVHIEFVAETPERLKGTIVSTAPKGGKEFSAELSGRWTGQSCAGIK